MHIKPSDFKNLVDNSLYIGGFCLAMTGGSFLANKLFHKVFGAKEGSTASKCIQGTIFASATAASIYLSKRIELESFTGKQVAAGLLFGRYVPLVQASVLFSYLGSYTFIPLGMISSMVGVSL